MIYLLDANVLIALTVAEHEHHERATSWAVTVDRFAVCPAVEGALVRFLTRIGESARAAAEVLRAVHAVPGCEFWSDRVSYAEADLTKVRGHREVTDAYLVSVAGAALDARVATFDRGLAVTHPDGAYLIPR